MRRSARKRPSTPSARIPTGWPSTTRRTRANITYSQGDRLLQTFADQTGGRCFFPYHIDDLAQSFLDIGTELRSQYYIAYAPTIPLSQGQYRKIEVQTDRKGAVVRTSKGYYAVPTGGQ